MPHPTAIERAATLLRDPVCVGRMRSDPLPPDVSILLRILAGDSDAEAQAARSIGKSASTVREAAEFYVTQVLFNSAADPYRILGASRDATRVELRTNLALLLRWLHPDVAGPAHRGMAERAIKAWNDLKMPDTRSTVDRELAKTRDAGRRRRAAMSRKPGGSQSRRRAPAAHDARGTRRRRIVIVALVLTAAVVGGMSYFPDELSSAASGLVASLTQSVPSVSTLAAQPDRQESPAVSGAGDAAPPSSSGQGPDRRTGDGR